MTLLISMFANFMAISSAVIWDEAAAVMLVFRSGAYLQRYLNLMDEDEITDNEELINPALGALLWAFSCHFIMSFAIVHIEVVVTHFREYGCFGFGKGSKDASVSQRHPPRQHGEAHCGPSSCRVQSIAWIVCARNHGHLTCAPPTLCRVA